MPITSQHAKKFNHVEFVPIARNVELLIAEMPGNNKGKQFELNITGHIRTNADLEGVITALVDAFVKLEV